MVRKRSYYINWCWFTGSSVAINQFWIHCPRFDLLVRRQIRLQQHLEPALQVEALFDLKILNHFDGTKLLLENDKWLLLRFSGTEPVLRIFAEADTLQKAHELVDWGKELISIH